MTKEEILKRNLLWLSDMKIQKDNDKVWAQFTSTDFTQSIYTAMQEFSDQENSSLIKEVERLKGLIKDAYDVGYNASSYAHDNSLEVYVHRPQSWEEFKTENNL